jgi:hypothetical protein
MFKMAALSWPELYYPEKVIGVALVLPCNF